MRFYEQFSDVEIDILRERAARLAALDGDAESHNLMAALTIRIGAERYAFPLDALITILQSTRITKVPSVPSFVAGIANVRGRIMPVIDMAQLYGVTRDATAGDDVIIVAGHDDISCAFRVCAVEDIVNVDTQMLKSLPGEMAVAHPEYFWGITGHNQIVINAEELITSDAIVVDETLS